MVNKYRYFITDQLLTSEEFFPFGEGELQEEFAPYGDFIADYKRSIKNKIVFKGKEFEHFYALELSGFRCDPITITIQKNCGDVWSDWFTGRIILSRGEWDWEGCSVTFQIETADEYECYEQKSEVEVDLFTLSGVGSPVITKMLPPNTVLEFVDYTDTVRRLAFEYWGGSGTAREGGWVLYRHVYTDNGTTWSNHTYWVREKRIEPCGFPDLNDPWILIDDDCPGTGKTYVRPASVFSCTLTTESNSSGVLINYEKICKIVGNPTGDNITEIDNGLLFRNVITALCDQCGYAIKSEFFQINPDFPSANNYVTGNVTKTANLIVYQKSDVKRPRDLNNATRMVTTWKEFIEDICLLYNLKFKISGGVFRIEHVSYFSKVPGIDTTLAKYLKFTFKKHKYTYETTKLPRIETWKFTEARALSDFEPNKITYDSKCANPAKEGEKNYEVKNITTDLILCLNNPSSESNVAVDAGIFIMATEEYLGQYYVITEPPIIWEQAPNNSLAWAQLLRDYHKYNRPFSTGRLNQQDATFISVIPTKKGEPLSIPFCCEDTFSPNDQVKTLLGLGTVDLATFSLKSGMLQLTLLYNADDNLLINHVPIANPDAAVTFKNIPVTIDVMGNDSDAEGIGTIIEIEIATPPASGTAEILSDKRIKFTPALDYTGAIAFYYRIKDNALQWSNIALVVVTVVDPTPDAVDDTYTVVRNTIRTLTGLMSNDYAGNTATSITPVTSSVVSAQGVTVLIYADGSFYYEAPDAVLVDTFDYTIQNNFGYQDTATVTINVVDPPTPNLHILTKSMLSAAEACSRWSNPAYRQNWYSPDATLVVGSLLYSDSGMTALAYYGFYSDGINRYFISAADGVIQIISSC